MVLQVAIVCILGQDLSERYDSKTFRREID
jgi:hypothetical protein